MMPAKAPVGVKNAPRLEPTTAALFSPALYATVIGSNLGAFFTPTGALAGIMWTGQLHDHGVSFSFVRFVKYGATVAVPAMAAALAGLWICCL
jgi:Na+/H+ antiporter NhaD/arsenite permease-like protein